MKEETKKEKHPERTIKHFCFSSKLGGGEESWEGGSLEIGNGQTKVTRAGPLTRLFMQFRLDTSGQ